MRRIEKKETGLMSLSDAARTTSGAILALKNDEVLLVTEVNNEHAAITLLPTYEGREGCHWYPAGGASSEKETLDELQRDGYELVYLEDDLELVTFLHGRVVK